MKIVRLSKKHKMHIIKHKGKPSITYCGMNIWNYETGKKSDVITCEKCAVKYVNNGKEN